jgi:hypothetical protein
MEALDASSLGRGDLGMAPRICGRDMVGPGRRRHTIAVMGCFYGHGVSFARWQRRLGLLPFGL